MRKKMILILFLLVTFNYSLHLMEGFTGDGIVLPLAVLSALAIIIMAVVILIMLVLDISKKKVSVKKDGAYYLIALILFLSLIIVPGFVMSKAAAFWQLYSVGPERIVPEGRGLIEKYSKEFKPQDERFIHFGFYMRDLTDLPLGIKSLNPIYVRLYKSESHTELVIKKFGFGDVAGFVVVPEGQACEGQKIIEGLCWIDRT